MRLTETLKQSLREVFGLVSVEHAHEESARKIEAVEEELRQFQERDQAKTREKLDEMNHIRRRHAPDR